MLLRERTVRGYAANFFAAREARGSALDRGFQRTSVPVRRAIPDLRYNGLPRPRRNGRNTQPLGPNSQET